MALKSINGLLVAAIKTRNGIAAASVKSVGGEIWTHSTVPGAPTIGTATATGATTATVSFTAGADGGSTILHYHAYSGGTSYGTLTQAGSGTISCTGLTTGTAYTFTVKATNAVGEGAASSASNSITPPVTGQAAYTTTTAGTNWTCPAGVAKVSVVCVGSGNGVYGGGTLPAGALAYKNNITVVPGNNYVVIVPATNSSTRASFNGNAVVSAGQLTVRTGDGGGDGGASADQSGAGAGGYSGNGGAGKPSGIQHGADGNAGTGGAGGSGGVFDNGGEFGGGGGGGVGLLGEGSSGAGGTHVDDTSGAGGGGGSGGGNGTASNSTYVGGTYGSAGGTLNGVLGAGKGGAVRIIWPGDARQFPSTRTTDE